MFLPKKHQEDLGVVSNFARDIWLMLPAAKNP